LPREARDVVARPADIHIEPDIALEAFMLDLTRRRRTDTQRRQDAVVARVDSRHSVSVPATLDASQHPRS
jgi:hypothetical protein